MITLKVTVTNGVAPTGIQILLDKVGGGFHDQFNEPLSFSKDYNLTAGDYLLTVNGINPRPNGTTTVELTGSFKGAPDPPSPQEQSTEHFTFDFFFTI